MKPKSINNHYATPNTTPGGCVNPNEDLTVYSADHATSLPITNTPTENIPTPGICSTHTTVTLSTSDYNEIMQKLNAAERIEKGYREVNEDLQAKYDSLVHACDSQSKYKDDLLAQITSKDIDINNADDKLNEAISKIENLSSILEQARPFVNSEIPSTFEVLMQSFKVEFKDGTVDNRHGDVVYSNGIISIYNSVSNSHQNANQLELTFYHELMHIVLRAIGEDEIADNERIVETLSRAIYSFLKTRRYDTQPKNRE